MRIHELSVKYPYIHWLNFINDIMNPSNVFVSENDMIRITDMKYVAEVGRLLTSTSKRTLANYQLWKYVESLVDFMPRNFIERQFEFKRVIEGVEEIPNRETKCLDEVMEVFGTDLSAMFMRIYTQNVRNDVKKMVEGIRKQARSSLERVCREQ